MAETYSVQDHFAKKDPQVRVLYDKLLSMLRTFGPIVEEPKKTSIHLVRVSALAGVETRRDTILLNIKSNHKISSPRVVSTDQVSASRFHQKVRLASPEDIDDELKAWLKDAHIRYQDEMNIIFIRQIMFTVQEVGTYQSSWQAVGSGWKMFGDRVLIEIEVVL